MTEPEKKILIVDDDQDFREILKIIFKKEKWITEEAFDGVDAMSKINVAKYDVILSDVNMPNLNGLELISEVRISDINRSTPVVLMSGVYSQEEVENIAGYKIISLLRKPLKYEDFCKTYLDLVSKQKKLIKQRSERDPAFNDSIDDIAFADDDDKE